MRKHEVEVVRLNYSIRGHGGVGKKVVALGTV